MANCLEGWMALLPQPIQHPGQEVSEPQPQGAYSYEGLVTGKSMTGLNEDTTGTAHFHRSGQTCVHN